MNDETFPVDWNEFREQWRDWKARNVGTRYQRSSWNFGPKNFCADEVLCKVMLPSCHAELSEVTFTIGKTTRYIGLTFRSSTRNETALVDNWADLERLLDNDGRDVAAGGE
jgi:hypothetical protein